MKDNLVHFGERTIAQNRRGFSWSLIVFHEKVKSGGSGFDSRRLHHIEYLRHPKHPIGLEIKAFLYTLRPTRFIKSPQEPTEKWGLFRSFISMQKDGAP